MASACVLPISSVMALMLAFVMRDLNAARGAASARVAAPASIRRRLIGLPVVYLVTIEMITPDGYEQARVSDRRDAGARRPAPGYRSHCGTRGRYRVGIDSGKFGTGLAGFLRSAHASLR